MPESKRVMTLAQQNIRLGIFSISNSLWIGDTNKVMHQVAHYSPKREIKTNHLLYRKCLGIEQMLSFAGKTEIADLTLQDLKLMPNH